MTSRAALAFIFITMLVDTIGLGIIIPVAPKIIMQLTGGGLAEASEYGGWLGFTFAAMLFLCAPVMGNLSDRFGRRPVLILSLLALGADYAITGLAPNIAWLFIGRFLSGMAGASYTTANAYIADVTPPDQRAVGFGLTGAAFSVGFVVGPALGGLLGNADPRLPFFCAAGLSLLNAAFGFFVMKESLAPQNRRPFEWSRANPLGSLAALSRFPGVLSLVTIFVLMRLAHDANPSIWTWYAYLKFHWTPKDVGYSLMFLGLVMALIYTFGIRIAMRYLGERGCAYLGLICGTMGFAGYAFATEGWMMYAWMAVWSLMAVAMPALNAILSKDVGPAEQGELQGALASIGGLTSVIAPPLLTHIFAMFTRPGAPVYFPGAAFLAAALSLLLAALVLASMTRTAAESGA